MSQVDRTPVDVQGMTPEQRAAYWYDACAEVERQLRQEREKPPAERIADVLHSLGFGAERHALAARMLRMAQDA